MKEKNRLSLLMFAAVLMIIASCKKNNDEASVNGNTDKAAAIIQNNQTSAGNVCEAVTYSNAAMKARMDVMERTVQAYIAQKYPSGMGGKIPQGGHTPSIMSVVTIPVVFHVVYNLAVQNISDAQLQSQIDVLNKDYTASNTDISNVPSVFQSLVGNAGLQFVLAKRDPNGVATTGIIRKSTTVTSFSSDGSVCSTSLGGDDAWPSSQYLNIWVCNKSGAAGYSSYPWSGNSASDGIIVGYNYVGTTGTFTNNWSYLLGRTITHEVGHWFGLVHIWGDATCGDDLVGDTPSQQAANGACPVFPHLSSCSPNSNGDMFMDYMDYSNDACRVMFSVGQVTRMLGYLNTTRASILTSLGGVAPNGSGSCNVPSGLNATSITTSNATFNWTSTGAVSYNVQYKPTASGTWITTSTSFTSIAVSGLSTSTSYQFQVQSVCSGTSSSYSTASTFSTLAPVCNVPAGLSTSSITSGSAVLNWAATGALSYSVMYKPSSSGTWSGASSSSNSLTISGLSPSTSYDFEVQSVCSGGSSAYSSPVSFTTLAPSCNVPTGLSASSITSSGAILSWIFTGALSYNIQYKSLSSGIWTSISSSTNSVAISGLSPSTTYQFKVQSVCSGSSSSYSSPASYTTTHRRRGIVGI
jgi:hypothetical protein